MPYPPVVKGFGIKRNGGVEIIEDLELPFPELQPGNMLVKPSYSSGRSGWYPMPFFPMPIAREVSGILLELPADEAILNSSEFKKRGFMKGGTVVLVCGLKECVGPMGLHDLSRPRQCSPSCSCCPLGQMPTTLTQITDAYNVKEGDTVFIHAVAG
ncbi:hypothetical protein BC826DRAFT_896423, partial [Russula brevipes]